MSQKLYVLLLSVITVSVALKCYKYEGTSGKKPDKDKLVDCNEDVTMCNNYTLKYGEVDKVVFDCGEKQSVCHNIITSRRRRDASEKCNSALAKLNVKSVMKDKKSKAECTNEIFKPNQLFDTSADTYLYCFNDVVWDAKEYMGDGKYEEKFSCEINKEKAHKLPTADITLSSKEDEASMTGIYKEGEESYTLMDTLYITCNAVMKLKDSSKNFLKWDADSDPKGWKFNGEDVDVTDICEMNTDFMKLPKATVEYTKEDGSDAGVVVVNNEKYTKETTVKVKCNKVQTGSALATITYDKAATAWKSGTTVINANSVLCEPMTCKATDFGMFTVYKDGADDAAKDGVIAAVPFNDGTVDHGDTVYLKCEKKDYVDIFEADTNLHAYKCDATSGKGIKVMGEMFKECISAKDYECNTQECNTDGCNAAAQLHMAMASLLLTIAYILW